VIIFTASYITAIRTQAAPHGLRATDSINTVYIIRTDLTQDTKLMENQRWRNEINTQFLPLLCWASSFAEPQVSCLCMWLLEKRALVSKGQPLPS
jgi:hypothetical protein